MEFRTTNFTQELFVEVTRFLLVLVEQFPIAEARLACFALVLALLDRWLFGWFVVRFLVLHELLVSQERVTTQFTDEWSDIDVL